MTHHRYVILGAGRQGTAAAYDLALYGDAREILLADASPRRAEDAATWIRRRVGDTPGAAALRPTGVDAADGAAVRGIVRGADAVLSALPYEWNLRITELCLDARASFCDLGGHPETVRRQLALTGRAAAAGISVLPDCGQAPGMATSLVALAMSMIDEPDTIELWDGGLPVDPQPPLYYRLTFAVAGLTNEYDGPCYNIRGGKVVALESLTEEQVVEFPPPLGKLEAFCASGTGSTAPWTYEGRLREFTSRVVRHPGHLAVMRTLKALGLFSLDPVQVDGRAIVPRRVTERVLEPLLVGEEPIRDVVVVRVHCMGVAGDRPALAAVDLMVLHDPETGFTAMQRCTGFDLAIVGGMLARGEIAPGVGVRERSVDPERYVAELSRRGMEVRRGLTAIPGAAS